MDTPVEHVGVIEQSGALLPLFSIPRIARRRTIP
jgi:hypothetical protein